MCIVHQINAKSGCFVCWLIFRPVALPQGSCSASNRYCNLQWRNERDSDGWILDDNMEKEDCGRPSLSAWWHCVVGVVYAE